MAVSNRLHKKTMARFGHRYGATVSCNDCFRPSADASKADLAEFHAEEMKLRRSKQRALTAGFIAVDRKSIW